MIRYYCSGFDTNNAFGGKLGEMLKNELKEAKNIVFIPGGVEKVTKAENYYIPVFLEHFGKIGIKFEKFDLINPEMKSKDAKELLNNADFILLMGGNPFSQKDLCEDLDILDDLKNFDGVMMGFSAGAMLMSKYIIITPCSEEYPDFHIEKGLNLDDFSIYPHNNTSDEIYPKILKTEYEAISKDDLIQVAKENGNFYLLQDFLRNDGLMDISFIKSTNGKIEFFKENNGKIWEVTSDNINLIFK